LGFLRLRRQVQGVSTLPCHAGWGRRSRLPCYRDSSIMPAEWALNSGAYMH
jgi:hypothetical protein